MIYNILGMQESDSVIHIYVLFFRFVSIIADYMNIVPCAIQQVLIVIHFMHS